jgi:hypothetical protein
VSEGHTTVSLEDGKLMRWRHVSEDARIGTPIENPDQLAASELIALGIDPANGAPLLRYFYSRGVEHGLDNRSSGGLLLAIVALGISVVAGLFVLLG